MSALPKPTAQITQRYQPRAIRFLHWHRTPGLWLKVYGITPPGGALPAATVTRALAQASAWYTEAWHSTDSPTRSPDHGLGFLILHAGTNGFYLLLDVWTDNNVLRHAVWRASFEEPTRFESLQESGIMACVWELAVMAHERSSWMRTMLGAPGAGDARGYLADVLNVDV